MPIELRRASEKKHWRRVMFANEMVGAITKDGLLYMFDFKDIASHLEMFPGNGQVWWFNDSRDRECAELSGDRVLVNPSAVELMIGYPLIWE